MEAKKTKGKEVKMELNEFMQEKVELQKELLNSVTMDIHLHIRVAKFINGMDNPRYWYILRGEPLRGKKYQFFQILTQTFLDNADSDRLDYIRLIKKICPEELKSEVIDSIYKSSLIPFVYNEIFVP